MIFGGIGDMKRPRGQTPRILGLEPHLPCPWRRAPRGAIFWTTSIVDETSAWLDSNWDISCQSFLRFLIGPNEDNSCQS